MIIEENMSVQKKLEILSDAAKYDVACTSSGVDRKGTLGGLGNTVAAGICHTFSADGRCISLLKILFTNECIFDCKYCLNRSSNDVVRASFTPEEVCVLTMEFYRRNYIEGLFLSSGVIKNPNFTMELLCETLRMLREVHHFNGYIHCKAVPGASSDIIEMTGWYADRMSVNLELPTAEGLKTLAPHKTRKNILKPMKQIQIGRNELIKPSTFIETNRMSGYAQSKSVFDMNSIESEQDQPQILREEANFSLSKSKSELSIRDKILDTNMTGYDSEYSLGKVRRPSINRGFVPAGQSTQMIIGATPENDYQILSVTEALYQKFDLKRVFFSAFIRVNEDTSLPVLPGGPPLLREHRLYQADWLLRFYGFQAAELLSEERPNFNVLLDPKCNWALGHLENFPIEVNKADYYTLLRVPGIGVRSAERIVKARRTAKLRFEDLKKIGVVLKRAIYFITCSGQMMHPVKLEENYLTNQLVGMKERLPFGLSGDISYQQLSLFDDLKFMNQNININ
ncbi:MAG: Radical domain protein [Lachnospiraceae bacterium]|jgi:putative DNA modification/repair radical SAM protein|nr:Radical domain protein [Lachnospiraceae bacterium]